MRYPARFKLTFGPWSVPDAALSAAAGGAIGSLREAVRAAMETGDLPTADPDRTTALVLALSHGAADLALSGHLGRDGKGNASPEDLVNDLLDVLKAAARDQARPVSGHPDGDLLPLAFLPLDQEAAHLRVIVEGIALDRVQ